MYLEIKKQTKAGPRDRRMEEIKMSLIDEWTTERKRFLERLENGEMVRFFGDSIYEDLRQNGARFGCIKKVISPVPSDKYGLPMFELSAGREQGVCGLFPNCDHQCGSLVAYKGTPPPEVTPCHGCGALFGWED